VLRTRPELGALAAEVAEGRLDVYAAAASLFTSTDEKENHLSTFQ
jgi:hypothetical protein